MKAISCLLTTVIYFLASSPLRAGVSPQSDVTLEEWTALCYQLTQIAALKACDQAIKLDPQQEKLWLSKGDALFSLENYEQAVEAYNQALKINDKSAPTWQKKGQAQAAQTKYGDALLSLDRALLIDQNNTSIWFDKGLVFFLQNKDLEAEEAYQKFLLDKPLNLILLSQVANNTLETFRSDKSYISDTEFIIIDNLNKSKKIIVKSENNIKSSRLFYSEIKVWQEKKILSQLEIIGDGEKVWAYRPDVNQYTELGYEEFVSGDKLIFTGLYNFFFLSTPELKQAKFVMLKTLLEITNTENFKQRSDIIAGRSYTVYEYKSRADEPSFKLWVNPEKASIQQIQFGLQSPEMETQITEKISQPTNESQSFKFTPPKGAKLVKELPNLYPNNINLFH